MGNFFQAGHKRHMKFAMPRTLSLLVGVLCEVLLQRVTGHHRLRVKLLALPLESLPLLLLVLPLARDLYLLLVLP